MNKRTILACKIAGKVNKRTAQNMNKRTKVAGNMNKRTPKNVYKRTGVAGNMNKRTVLKDSLPEGPL